jgi:hypothetical protein
MLDDDTGLKVASGVLLAGAAQGLALRMVAGIDRELSVYADRRKHWWIDQGRKASIGAQLAVGISLGVYLLARRLREDRTPDPID